MRSETQKPQRAGSFRSTARTSSTRSTAAAGPSLLLHGGTLTGDSWEPYLAAFAEHFRLIVPDTPGHGRSGTPDADPDVSGPADDWRVHHRPRAPQAVIAGYSDGGQIALEIGMRHPA